MSKLNTLLETQAKLSNEVEGLKAFLNVVHGQAPLKMAAGAEVIEFEADDLGVELKILEVLKETFAQRVTKLEATNRKIAALEELIS